MLTPDKGFEISDSQDELVYQCILCEFVVYEWGGEDREYATHTAILDENGVDHMSPDYVGEPPDDEEGLCPECYEHLVQNIEEPISKEKGEYEPRDTKPSREFVFLAFRAWQMSDEVDEPNGNEKKLIESM